MKIRSLFLLAASALLALPPLVDPADARRFRPLPCDPAGDFLITNAPLTVSSSLSMNTVSIRGSLSGAGIQIAGSGCPEIPAVFRPGRGFTTVVARWVNNLCPGYKRLVVKGRIAAPGCRTFEGFVRGRGLKKVTFSAVSTAPATTTTTRPPLASTTTTLRATTTSTSVSTPTTTSSSTTSTTIPIPSGCCAAGRMVLQSTSGTINMGGLFPGFPFPAGMSLTVTMGPPDGSCRHDAVIPADGFSVPAFCFSYLNNATIDIVPAGCDTGPADGRGSVWDGGAPASGAGCPDTDVRKAADTRDGVCDTDGPPPGVPCLSTAPNGLGDVDATVGDGTCETTPRLHTVLDIPAVVIVWQDGDGTVDCPDEDGVYDVGVDTLHTMSRIVLTPTTGRATALFQDENADGCSRQGSGPQGPILHTGTPANGPCCTAGQSMTLAFAGAVFSDQTPQYDYLYRSVVQMTTAQCGAAVPLDACTLSDACLR
jgi:hypothetical protein